MIKLPPKELLHRLIWIFFGVIGCQTPGQFSSSLDYDRRFISVQTVNLFNQRIQSNISSNNWKGDWLLRRHRLELVDRELRITRPDVILFQEMMSQKGSKVEADMSLLAHGALQGYEWDTVPVGEYEDTSEVQYNGVAIALPLGLSLVSKDMQKFWQLGTDGSMTLSVVELDDRPILLFNIEMPSKTEEMGVWYVYVREQIEQIWRTTPYCPERTIIAGNLPQSTANVPLTLFLQQIKFKDTAADFCDLASDCYTCSPHNELFQATSNNAAPGQYDRVLVHNSAVVSSGKVNMNTSDVISPEDNHYNLSRLWPSTHFGWHASFKLGACPQK